MISNLMIKVEVLQAGFRLDSGATFLYEFYLEVYFCSDFVSHISCSPARGWHVYGILQVKFALGIKYYIFYKSIYIMLLYCY